MDLTFKTITSGYLSTDKTKVPVEGAAVFVFVCSIPSSDTPASTTTAGDRKPENKTRWSVPDNGQPGLFIGSVCSGNSSLQILLTLMDFRDVSCQEGVLQLEPEAESYLDLRCDCGASQQSTLVTPPKWVTSHPTSNCHPLTLKVPSDVSSSSL
ncbi:hypothetical protein PFLUV_G00142920 [Perca fluviatilis]|uniref:Uncharacterized protein n=1 Tax=Perca fluviatilis TaxID=8168 RepID=A0A6A5EUW5_PERFL|nr:hypothetical protein PFLUV_G00142920 [Perca fluviatilis]